MEAKCGTCGITVVITDIRSGGYSFQMKPGLALSQLCPVIIKRIESGATETEDACANLTKAIQTRIEEFRNGSN